MSFNLSFPPDYPLSPPFGAKFQEKNYLCKFLLLPFPYIPVTSIRFLSPEEVAPGTPGNDGVSRGGSHMSLVMLSGKISGQHPTVWYLEVIIVVFSVSVVSDSL